MQTTRVFGAFEIIRRLGDGRTATVYEARSVANGEKVALKIPKDGSISAAAMEKEASRARCIQSPFVVQVLGTASDRGVVGLVLELVEGVPVNKLFSQGPMSEGVVAAIGHDLAQAMRAAHEASDAEGREMLIVHGDISSGNVIVGVDGRARMTDFGLSRRRAVTALTSSGLIRGTPGYIAPELIRGGTSSPASDVFAWAMLCAEGLLGSAAFSRAEAADTFRATVEDPMPQLPGAIGAMIMKAASKRPERRPTARDLLNELKPPEKDERDELARRVARLL